MTFNKMELSAQLRKVEPSQEHLLAFWDRLEPVEQEKLARQIAAIDFELVTQLYQGQEATTDWQKLAERAESPPAVRSGAAHGRFSSQEAVARGEAALKGGKIGMILVAGGQGTRLGFDHPKGMFPLGPVSNRPLFQILIEHLRAISQRYRVSIPLYLMTSPATHDETVSFLNQNNRFGLPANDLHIFCQGTMPAVDANSGRVLMESRGGLCLSPDGHGGMLAAFEKSGCLTDAQRRNIDHFFYGQIDNPLLQVCSPELIGYHLLANSELTTQVVRKREPLERVGNVVSIDGRVQIIEYSDLPESAARLTNADGSLKLWAGNLAVHVFDRSFLERMTKLTDGLPFHRAKKKTPCIDDQGNVIEPNKPNSIKFERFIFDLLPAAKNAIVVESDPAEAFAPVKNSNQEKTDTPATSQAAMLALYRRWLREAGVDLEETTPVEISPLFALDVNELRSKLLPGTKFAGPTYLQ